MELLAITTNFTTSFLLNCFEELQIRYLYLLSRSPSYKEIAENKTEKNRAHLLILQDKTGMSGKTTIETLSDYFKSKPHFTFIISKLKVAPYTDPNFYIKVNQDNYLQTSKMLSKVSFKEYFYLVNEDSNQLCYAFVGNITPELKAKIVETITWINYPGSDRFITTTRADDAPIVIKSEGERIYLPYLENVEK